MADIKKYIILLFLILFLPSIVLANECAECKRAATIGHCENKALPENFLKEQAKYDECLKNELNLEDGENYFADPDEPQEEWEQAKETCKDLLVDYNRSFSPISTEVMFSNLQTWIAATLTCNRFHIQNIQMVSSYLEEMEESGMPIHDKSRPAAYFFEATYDCAKEPVYNDYNEERYPSSLNIRMYYDGPQKELVKEWTVNSPHHSWMSLTNRMFKNRGSATHEPALMRQSVPITHILDEFEKVPETCRISPEKHIIPYNTDMTIHLDAFKDAKGRDSREFNRVLVVVESGSVTNGVRPEGIKKDNAAIFQVGDGEVKVNYRAPDASVSPFENIKVFHCHNIAQTSVWPLEKTDISNKVIANEKVMFKFPGVTAVLEASKKTTRHEEWEKRNQSVQKHWDEMQSAEVFFQLEDQPRLSLEVREKTGKLGVTRYRYRVRNVSLISMTHRGSGHINTDISGMKVSTTSRLTAGQAEVSLESEGSMLKMDVDSDTGEIVRVYFPHVVIKYDTKLETHGVRMTGENTYPIDSETDKDIEWGFSQDFADDDTGECYLVKGGDGKSTLEGGAEKQKGSRYSTVDYSGFWSVSIQPD